LFLIFYDVISFHDDDDDNQAQNNFSFMQEKKFEKIKLAAYSSSLFIFFHSFSLSLSRFNNINNNHK
jgi:hypothetical protein